MPSCSRFLDREIDQLRRYQPRQSLVRHLQDVIVLIERRLATLARALGWQRDLARLRSLPGIGPLMALALLEARRSGSFSHRDPYIAFVETKDSGQHRGRRKLTRPGNPEIRRLLYNAAMATIHPGRHFHPLYLALQARGLAKTQALDIVSRKLARVAFVLLKNQSSFNPEACRATWNLPQYIAAEAAPTIAAEGAPTIAAEAAPTIAAEAAPTVHRG